jgi:L-rhamnose mutarotase
MKRYCLTLDLKDDPQLIAEYEAYHQQVWPEILASIKDVGITGLEIYRLGTRLSMIMEVNEQFCFETKGAADAANPKVQEWETLMWKYQQALPGQPEGVKWVLMDRIFKL